MKIGVNDHRGIFENSPIPFWEEDFSLVNEYFHQLRDNGITNFRTFFEENPNEVLKASQLIKVLDINQASCEMFHVKNKEELSRAIPDYFTEGSLVVFKEELIALAEGKTKFQSLIPILALDGEELTVELRLNVVQGHEDDLSRVIVSFLDITARKKAEEALEKAYEELEESNSAKDKLFSIIAHDLQNPFNAIIGFSDLLFQEYEELSDDERKHYADIINQSSQGALGMLQNLLSWSRLQLKRIEFNPKVVNLLQLTQNAVSPYLSTALLKSINTKIEISEKVPVFVDPNLMQTVIGNLYSNAVKFTPENGIIELKASVDKDYVNLSVTDNGIGIPKEKIDQMFSIEGSYTTLGTNNEKGTGLGLVLCKEFTEMNGGEIKVESVPNKGTTFKLNMPIHY